MQSLLFADGKSKSENYQPVINPTLALYFIFQKIKKLTDKIYKPLESKVIPLAIKSNFDRFFGD
jgi:hypothetical protein